jgi:hypothetical protein
VTKVADVTNAVTDGHLRLRNVDKGIWRIIAIFAGRTRQKVKRAAPGGEGWEVDHFDSTAVAHYLQRFEKAFEQTGTPYPHTFFNDSYEVHHADWTPRLLQEFEKRRGYKLEYRLRHFADGDPIVFQDCDHAMSCENFEINDDVEAAIMSFKSREPHFGYIKYIGGKDTQYAGTVEKNPVSNYAIFGCYYFKNADVFAKAAVLYFNDGTQKEYYMSGLYNYLLNVKRIDVKEHFEFGTPDELKELKSEVSENELKGKLGL